MSNTAEIQLGLSLPETTTLADWAKLGHEIYNRAESLTWQVADWAAFGERRWGALIEFCKTNKRYSYGTLRVYAYVASRIQLLNRFNKLGFAHHVEVAKLNPDEQAKWLKLADKNGWSVSELRANLRESGSLLNAKVGDGAPLGMPMKRIIDAQNWLTDWYDEQPPEFWTVETRAYWKENLKPFVEIYEKL